LPLHFALGRAFEIAQRCSFEIFLGPVEDRFVDPFFHIVHRSIISSGGPNQIASTGRDVIHRRFNGP
jgi:hypothetical protein